jgi:murein tripeptide amidase MpaA
MFHKRRIATTLLNNNVECITVTNPQSTKVKPVIFLTARVHPGETPSSYMLEGMINALLANNKQA